MSAEVTEIRDKHGLTMRETLLSSTPSAAWDSHELISADYLPPPTGIMGGRLLTRKTVSLLAGPPGVGKTWLAIKLADAATNGGTFAGFQLEQVRTLILEEEMMAEEFRERLMEFHVGQARGLRLRFCQDLNFGTWNNGGEKLRSILEKEQKPDLVIIDAFQEVIGGYENNNDYVMRVMKALRKIAQDYDCAILMIDHFGKPGEHLHGADQIRGALAKRGTAANIFLADVDAEGKRMFLFKKTRRMEEPKPITWELYKRADERLDCVFYNQDGDELE